MEKIKVLLVEDEPTLAMIIKDTLDGNEFDITLAANGEEGLSRYAEIKPDIIVADIMMPKMDGYMATTEIRSCFIYQLSHRMTTCFFAANSGITCRTIEAASFSFDSFFCHIRYPRGTDR